VTLADRSAAVPGIEGSAHGAAATPLGGFLDRIAETITQADAAAS
jgi:hypothetical protein